MKIQIKNIVEIQHGYQLAGSLKPDPNGSHAIIQIKDIRQNPGDYSQLDRINPERNPELYQVSKGDVLFLSRGHKLFAAAIDQDLKNTIVSGYFFILRLKTDNVLPEYLAWYINQNQFQSDMSTYVKGSHMPLISKSDFQELEINIPPIEMQKKIVELARLTEKEKYLVESIQKKRQQLINTILLKAIHSQMEIQ
jgi:restriction endonuclease S subunit